MSNPKDAAVTAESQSPLITPESPNAMPHSSGLSGPVRQAIVPESVPAPLAASINAMMRSMPSSALPSTGLGLSISIAGEASSATDAFATAQEPSSAENLRTAELRAKGASLVQRVMMDKGRLAGAVSPDGIVASADDDEPIFVAVDGSDIAQTTVDLQSVGQECGVEPACSTALSAIDSLQYAEATLEQLFADSSSPAPLYKEPQQQAATESYLDEPVGVRSRAASDAAIHELAQSMSASSSPASPVLASARLHDENSTVAHRDSLDIDGLYVAMAGGRNRWDATSRMVEWIAKALPGAHVRCGLGASRLKRFVDARLGWLGSESSLQRAMAGQWRAQLGDSAESTFRDGNAMIRLNCPGRNQIALLSLEGERITQGVFETLRAHETAIAAILWGRPRHALPEWSGTKGRPRVAIMVAGVMLLLLVVCPVPYPASCTVLVEPVGSRVVSAPFEAMLESVAIEPGDEVTKGQLIAVLDGRPLRLEQQSIDAEIQQATKQQDVAIAAGRIAEAQLAQLKCQQLKRHRELLERRLNQLNITSPIEGVVVAGDLRRSIGIPLESGQVLFEIAPLDRVLLEVEIPEREIGLVNEDSPVQLRVESARTGNVDATLTKIYPMAQLREEQSVFVAPIEVENSSRQYRPGMRGRATVFGPVRPWAWRHIRGVVEQVAWLARW